MAAKRLWTEVYRPKSLEEYVFQDERQRAQIERFVLDKDIPNLLLTGIQGSGKSTIAKILISELEIDDADVLYKNASSTTGVDAIRNDIESFSQTMPLGKFKIVQLEEFERLSTAAQDALKAIIEDSSDTCRFICTSNHENRITPAIKSRLQHIRYKAPIRDDVLMRMCEILLTEEVEFDPEILDKYVAQAYPDIRKIINNLQLNTVNGKLTQPSIDTDGSDYLFKLVDLVMEGNLQEIRRVVTTQCTPEQLEEVYEFLYKNLHKHPQLKEKSKYEQALLILLDGVYKNGLVAIPHLNFEAMCIKLCNITGE